MSLVSIVIPAFNEAGNIIELLDRLSEVLNEQELRHEIIVVDDGSSDNTFGLLRRRSREDPCVRGLRLSRNFGHQNALLAGLHATHGDIVVMMDGDLQHPPEIIPMLIAEWRRGFQVVHTIRTDSTESSSFLKRMTSKVFYRMFRGLSGLPIEPGMADFRLLDRRALEPVLRSGETRIFLRGMFVWVGFSQTAVEYQAGRRNYGATGYSLGRMVALAAQAIVAYSEAPLYGSLALGTIVAFLSMTYGAYALGIKVFTETAVPGWTSIAVVITFLFGVQLVLLGVLGVYLGSVYAEVKNRPAFIVAEDTKLSPSGTEAGDEG